MRGPTPPMMRPSPHPADGAEAALVAPRSPARSGQREEVEAGAGGGARQREAKEGVDEGDGEAGEDALVDLGLAGAEAAAELLGTVAHRAAGAVRQGGDERGQIVLVRGDDAGQAGGAPDGRERVCRWVDLLGHAQSGGGWGLAISGTFCTVRGFCQRKSLLRTIIPVLRVKEGQLSGGNSRVSQAKVLRGISKALDSASNPAIVHFCSNDGRTPIIRLATGLTTV